MAAQYPNSRHFLTYRHSLRSYASILYLRVPPSFRVILRGKDVEHHNIVNDMMMTNEITYRPQPGLDRVSNDLNKTYWSAYCHKIGYALRRHKKTPEDEPSPDYSDDIPSKKSDKKIPTFRSPEKFSSDKQGGNKPSAAAVNGGEKGYKPHTVFGVGASSSESTSPSDNDLHTQTTMTIKNVLRDISVKVQ